MTDLNSEQAAQILRGVLRLGRRLRAVRRPGNTSLSEIGLLGTLRRLGPMPAVRLAAEENLQPQSLTRMIGSLERQGCIARIRSEADRREVLIGLTDDGRRVLADEMHVRGAWLERAAATLSDAEIRLLVDAAAVMQKLAEAPARDQPNG
jgi:DNA-binding MarR family transcriptional regulator